MPLGWERINVKQTQPNKNIVFIKPIAGPDENTAKDFLQRIAAQCLPVMNKHHLAVVSLEEYEPNLEFWGRNFNNGEVIQLVLKSPSTSHWLPFKFVQMVMMHELAHCKQMNHSKAFWAVRNEYSTDMKALWDKGYTGEGLWGRGVLLENGAFAQESLDPGEILPEHLCGGTFRSRGVQKRKVKPKITYRERQERRIKKKFGTNGLTLGADEEIKSRLENGKRPAGKPRVASSARGRELRAAAALARFEVKEPQIKDEDLVTDSEAESDYDVVVKVEPDDALDINGKQLLDREGHGMVKVCEDEDEDSDEVKKERLDLQGIPSHSQMSLPKSAPRSSNTSQTLKPPLRSKTLYPLDTAKKSETSAQQQPTISKVSKHSKEEILSEREISTASEDRGDIAHGVEKPRTYDGSCPVCSMTNEKIALICMVCSNVLKPEFVPNSWRCQSLTCAGSCYVNGGDVGLCGVCGNRKCS